VGLSNGSIGTNSLSRRPSWRAQRGSFPVRSLFFLRLVTTPASILKQAGLRERSSRSEIGNSLSLVPLRRLWASQRRHPVCPNVITFMRIADSVAVNGKPAPGSSGAGWSRSFRRPYRARQSRSTTWGGKE